MDTGTYSVSNRFTLAFKYLPILVLGLSCLIIAYVSVLTNCYARTDDYSAIYKFNYCHISPFSSFWLSIGRPIMGVATWLLFKNISRPDELWAVRFVGLIGTALCGFTFFILYRVLAKWTIIESGSIAILLVLTPAFGVYTGWAVCAFVPYCITFALCLGVLLVSFRDGPPIRLLSARVALMLVGIIFCECIYQPAAGFFLFPVILQVTRDRSPSRDILLLSKSLLIFSLALALYFVAFQLNMKLFFPGDPNAARGALCIHPLARIKYFIVHPLYHSFSFWGPMDGIWRGRIEAFIVLCLFGIGGLTYLLRCEASSRLTMAVLLLLSFVLMVAPLLAAKDNYAPFRTIAISYAFILYFSGIGIKAIFDNFTFRSKRIVAVLAWTLIVLTTCLGTRYWVLHGLILPNEREFVAYREYVRKTISKPVKTIYFSYPTIPPKLVSGMSPMDEYGIYSSWLPWVPKPMLTIILCDQFGSIYEQTVRKSPRYPIIVVCNRNVLKTKKNGAVVDGTQALSELVNSLSKRR